LPQGPNQRWSLDFVHDQLSDGRRFRILKNARMLLNDALNEKVAIIENGRRKKITKNAAMLKLAAAHSGGAIMSLWPEVERQ
jgi:hypothetical protein